MGKISSYPAMTALQGPELILGDQSGSTATTTPTAVAAYMAGLTTTPVIASYARTAAEIAAGVTPTNYAYLPGNVLRYGADPTGVTSSATAFNSAISVFGTNGGTLYLPLGNFLLDAPVAVPENLIIQGAGWGTQISLTSAAAGAFTFAPTTGTANTAAITIKNLWISGTSSATYGIWLQNCAIVRISGVQFTGFTDASSNCVYCAQNVFETIIRDCYFPSLSGVGINLVGASSAPCNNNQIISCTMSAGANTCIGIVVGSGCENTLITGCDLEGAGIGNVGINCSGSIGTTIIANYIESWAGTAIAANSGVATGLTITGNELAATSTAAAVVILNSSGPNQTVIGENNTFLALGDSGYSSIGFLVGDTASYMFIGNRSTGSGTEILNIAAAAQAAQDAIGSSTAILLNSPASIDTSGRVSHFQLVSQFTGAVGNKITQGSGAPSTPGGNPTVGDFYLRTDTPGTSGQRIYICTVGGSAPTWVGLI